VEEGIHQRGFGILLERVLGIASIQEIGMTGEAFSARARVSACSRAVWLASICATAAATTVSMAFIAFLYTTSEIGDACAE